MAASAVLFFAFLFVLTFYSVYSAYERLDGRYPIFAATALLVVASVTFVAGDSTIAQALGLYVIALVTAGIALLAYEQLTEKSNSESSRGRDGRAKISLPDPGRGGRDP
jgi:hypothetical protein